MKKALALLIFFFLIGCKTGHNYYYTLSDVQKRPASYKNKICAFSGKVLKIEESSGKTFMQIIVPDHTGDSLFVAFGSTTNLQKNMWCVVLGEMGDPVNYKNAFGGTLTAQSMRAFAVMDSHYVYRSYFKPEQLKIYEQWESGELKFEKE